MFLLSSTLVRRKIKEQKKIEVPFFEFWPKQFKRVQKTGQDPFFRFAKVYGTFEVLTKKHVEKTHPLGMTLRLCGMSNALDSF